MGGMKTKDLTPEFQGKHETPRNSARGYCRWCNAGPATTCVDPECTLFPYRLAKVLPGNKMTLLRAIRTRCLKCAGGNAETARTCTAYKPFLSQPACHLWPHRDGKRNVSPEYRAERREQALNQREKAGAAPGFLSLLPFSEEEGE